MKTPFRKTAAQMAKFAGASVASFAVDWILFTVLWLLLPGGARGRLFVSVCAARCLSLVFNFACNRNFVFPAGKGGKEGTGRPFARYLALAAALLVGSWALLKAVHAALPAFPLSAAKPVVDLALFFLSFHVQRRFVFGRGARGGGKP